MQALQQAASTGRLFIGDGKSQPVTPAQWGPALEVRWQWHEVTQASTGDSGWVLRPQLDEHQAKLCLNNPPLYLDIQRGVCGLAQVSDISLGQVAVLLKTPPLKSEALKKHQLALAERLGSLPLPPVLEQLVTLTGINPKACLHLSPVLPPHIPQDGPCADAAPAVEPIATAGHLERDARGLPATARPGGTGEGLVAGHLFARGHDGIGRVADVGGVELGHRVLIVVGHEDVLRAHAHQVDLQLVVHRGEVQVLDGAEQEVVVQRVGLAGRDGAALCQQGEQGHAGGAQPGAADGVGVGVHGSSVR